MIVGAWPLDLDDATTTRAARAFAERLAQWQEKALREAKLATDWAVPNEAYETRGARAAASRSSRAMTGTRSAAEIVAFAERIAPAGAVNGLAQTLLKLTAPGRARHLSGHGVLGLQPGRSGQPTAGRFRRTHARTRHAHGRIADADLARRPDQAGADGANTRVAAALARTVSKAATSRSRRAGSLPITSLHSHGATGPMSRSRSSRAFHRGCCARARSRSRPAPGRTPRSLTDPCRPLVNIFDGEQVDHGTRRS